VSLLGHSVAENPRVASAYVGMMLENNPLPGKLRVGEYLRFRARMKGIAPGEAYRHAERIMRHCDLYYQARHRRISALSKGFRQRVGVAEALLGTPKIVLLDEPTIGLDPHQILRFRQLIEAFRGRYTFLISSHVLSEIESLCDRVLILCRGRLVADGDVARLKKEFLPEATLLLQLRCDAASIRSIGQKYPRWKLRHLRTDLRTPTQQLAIDFSDTLEEKRAVGEAVFAHDAWEVLGLEEKKATLEDVFLAATRRYWDTTLPKKDEKVLLPVPE